MLLLGVVSLGATPSARAGEGDAILQELRSFATTGTVLHLAAHPDDENTLLITYLSRGRGYRTAYLSLTRGDGGQNERGRDLDEKLGVARTQELLAARKLDGGRQFFTRAIDFGYSKSPEETLRFWDRDEVLADVVRVYRTFRPDVVVTRFPVPPGSGGHGHHTASAILAVEAFNLSGDPAAYPEQLAEGLTPWKPKRVLWNSWSGRGAGALTGPTIVVDIGGDDPVTGEAFASIANESRAMHKTQGLGGFAGRGGGGPSPQNFMLLAGEPATGDLMDGVDLTWARVPGGEEIDALAKAAIDAFKPAAPAASLPALLAIRAKLAALPTDPLVTYKRAQIDRILQVVVGLQFDATADRPEVVPGEAITISTRLNVEPGGPVSVSGLRFLVNGRTVKEVVHPDRTALGDGSSGGVITVPLDTPLTQPYWLLNEGSAGIARVDDARMIGLPENPPAVTVEMDLNLSGQTMTVATAPLIPTDSMPRQVVIIPPVSLQLGSEIYLVAPGTTKAVTVDVAAARAGIHGSLRLEAPTGWVVAPALQHFRVEGAGRTQRVTFEVTAPATAGSGHFTATARVDGHEYSNQRQEIRYDHIPLQLLQPPARSRVVSFEMAKRGRSIGYLPGAGDYVAECLEQMGYEVRRLTGADLTPEGLEGLDAVVIGVRAFNERGDLAANFPGLLAWVEAGGNAIAQYNRTNGLDDAQLGPYPLSIQGSAPALRVTDETAPVAFLAPEHPALNTPNKITAADFDGWVQERGAYFPSSWDENRYSVLLAMSDPGEAPLTSSILVARHGEGHYVYTGVAFFRQLPAGVPGVWRLFANLVSLGN